MTIGIDASRSIDLLQKTGVEVVSDDMLRVLSSGLEDSDLKVRYYTPAKINFLPWDKQKILRLPRFWTVFRLSLEMLMYKPDVFFSPVHELPFFCPKKTYRVIHDVAFLKAPENYSTFQNWYLRFGLRRSLKVCCKIFVSTHEVKQDLVELALAKEDKIIVTSFGYTQKGKNKVNFRKKQFFYIGRIEDKKNIKRLVQAFELFSKDNMDYKLVLAGKPGFGFHNIEGLVKKSKANIELLEFISNDQKYQYLSESKCLAHVALEEGFGIPILEAFDFSLPVLASDIPVLREVGGMACYYVNPKSVEDIAVGMAELIEKKDLRDLLAKKGKEQLEKYSWQRVIQKILGVISE